MVEALRSKTIGERLDLAFELWRFVRDMAYCAERMLHPELDEAALARRVADRMSRGTR